MAGLKICRLGRHEMRELESNRLVIATASSRFKFHAKLVELDRQEVDRHITVKSLCICPALHPILVRKLLVHREERIQLIIVNVPVLECTRIHHIMDSVENLIPFPFVFLNGNSIFTRLESSAHHGLLTVNPRGNEGRKPA